MEVISETIIVRAVRKADLDQVFSLLKDLMVHDGILDTFIMTRERLDDELFGALADWNCLVAADESNNITGFLTYTFANIHRANQTTSMIHVDDLFVRPAQRKTKIAYQLFHYLATIAAGKNIHRLNVWCRRNNDLGQHFYQSIGCQKLDYMDVFSVPVDRLLG
jgi:GNAT superfamily N-acetyltransferase